MAVHNRNLAAYKTDLPRTQVKDFQVIFLVHAQLIFPPLERPG